jgi:predicted Zn-dependent peptidase
MRDYFRCRYSPGNIVLAAAGRIDFDELVADARRCCGDWLPCEVSRTVVPAATREAFQTVRKESASQQYLLQYSAAPAAEDRGRFPAKLLAAMLGDDSGSRLYWELVDPGLAEQVTISHAEHQGAGILMTYMSCEPVAAADNLRRIAEVFRRAEADGLAADELAQAKSKVRSRIVLSGERPRGRLFALGGDWVYRREYRPIEQDLDEIAAIGLDEVSAVLEKYPLTRSAAVTIGPLANLSPSA